MVDDAPQTLSNSASSKSLAGKTRWPSICRRARWVILIPFILVFIIALIQGRLHPVTFDTFDPFVGNGSSWGRRASGSVGQTIHEPHLVPYPRELPHSSAAASASTASSTSTTVSTSAATSISETAPIPTIPSNPPALPTPFPKPFDDNVMHDFSSDSCFTFFYNMTSRPAFQNCRPLSLLINTSSSFIEAQTNITLLNTILWGLCNTDTAKLQCSNNMSWFASTLQDSCKKDLEDQKAFVVNVLNGLQAYSLMRDAGCLTDPVSNTYCYVNAVRSPSPSDVYFYFLALGSKPPSDITPSCSPCTRDLFATYAAALNDPKLRPRLTGLTNTYGKANELITARCGERYSPQTNGAASARGMNVLSWRWY